MTQKPISYDLEERTAKFGEAIIRICLSHPESNIPKSLFNQLVRAATSIGANYCKADDSESPKDFKHKIGIVKKETRETKHFLRMLATALPDRKNELRLYWQEAKELILIFNAIYRKLK